MRRACFLRGSVGGRGAEHAREKKGAMHARAHLCGDNVDRARAEVAARVLEGVGARGVARVDVCVFITGDAGGYHDHVVVAAAAAARPLAAVVAIVAALVRDAQLREGLGRRRRRRGDVGWWWRRVVRVGRVGVMRVVVVARVRAPRAAAPMP